MEHELNQHTQYLRAALQQDRRPLGLLFGAGAPCAVRVGSAPIIPDIVGLTEIVRTKLGGAGAVFAAFEQLDGSGVGTSSVEHILNYIRLLSAIPGDTLIGGFSKKDLMQADEEICAIIRQQLDVNLPSAGTPFHSVALWARATRRHAAVEVFTTNYDLLLEQALDSLNVPYFDGFVGSHRPAFDLQAIEEDQLPNRWLRLWKIHGSVNWRMNGDSVVRCVVDEKSERTMIYPSHLKYAQSRRLPYLALLDRLRTFLRQPSAILISSGFAFRDEHINEVLEQSLRANPTASLQGLLYGTLDGYPEARDVAERTPNLTLIARDGAVVGLNRGQWAANVDGPTYSDMGDFATLGDLMREVIGESRTNVAPAVEDEIDV